MLLGADQATDPSELRWKYTREHKKKVAMALFFYTHTPLSCTQP